MIGSLLTSILYTSCPLEVSGYFYILFQLKFLDNSGLFHFERILSSSVHPCKDKVKEKGVKRFEVEVSPVFISDNSIPFLLVLSLFFGDPREVGTIQWVVVM